MRRVEPKVFLIGETALDEKGVVGYLGHIGTKWNSWTTSPDSDSETLIEIMGRLCYRSWEPGMNPNVTKVREGNDAYIANILKSKHGSVLEHAVSNWIFADVSRVFTHELVRHRAGTAFSQESLRYVRLNDLGLWIPPDVEESQPGISGLFEQTFTNLEQLQVAMAQVFKLDQEKSFDRKKKLTSFMRRVAPEGMATTIGVSFNMRALRHVISMRTAEHSEAEIRLVFDKVAVIAKDRWPNIFADYTRNEKGEWVTPNEKV